MLPVVVGSSISWEGTSSVISASERRFRLWVKGAYSASSHLLLAYAPCMQNASVGVVFILHKRRKKRRWRFKPVGGWRGDAAPPRITSWAEAPSATCHGIYANRTTPAPCHDAAVVLGTKFLARAHDRCAHTGARDSGRHEDLDASLHEISVSCR